ncbi:MAG: glyoxalase [Candidatus Cohnella colombiensis]|uniref:Glyoxalase n=1 Tax=Candidatus Cohnella colombiensis TaxID=3121368 RepID=A0AA95EV32_9BACL|nr:MAG: glyoxalase [Cohnella sp.]
MTLQRISLVTIGTWNLPLLRSFYKRLGWTETEWSTDSYCVFKTAGGMLSIWPMEEMTQGIDLPKPEGPNYFRGVTLSLNTDVPEQVDEIIEHARDAGARIIHEPNEAFWGGRTGGFLDPENNYWEVAFNPKSVFDERGAMIEMNG